MKIMRWAILLVPSAGLMAAALVWQIGIVRKVPQDVALSHRTALAVEKIQPLSVLTTLKLDVTEAQLTVLQGYTGTIKAVLVIQGDVTVGVDLARARFEQVDEQAHTAVLVLPQPKVQSTRLDQERTKLVGVWPSGLWTIVPGGEDADTTAVNLAYRDAQRAVTAAALAPQVLARSRQQAESVLRTFLSAVGWEVQVRWEERVSVGPAVRHAAGPRGWPLCNAFF